MAAATAGAKHQVSYRSRTKRKLAELKQERSDSLRRHAEKYVPLVSEESRSDVRAHKGYAVLGGAGGLLIVAPLASAGGTVLGGLATLGGAILLKASSKKGRGSAAAAGFFLTGAAVCILNAIAGGSLTGTAKLGSSIHNLKMLANQVRVRGLNGVGDVYRLGLGFTPSQLRRMGVIGFGQMQVPPELARFGRQFGLSGPRNPALRGRLGDYFNGEVYNPVTEVGARTPKLGALGQTGPQFALSPFAEEQGRFWTAPGENDGPAPGAGLSPAIPIDSLALALRGGPDQQVALQSGDSATARVFGPVPASHIRVQVGAARGWVVPNPTG